MSKILCISQCMSFQNYWFCKALQNHFEEVKLVDAKANTEYTYIKDEADYQSFLIPNNLTAETLETYLSGFDCILGLSQKDNQTLEHLKITYPNLKKSDIVFGLHVLDYPVHVLDYNNKDFNARADADWKTLKEKLNNYDFVAHNQKISLDLLQEHHADAIGRFVRFPVKKLEATNPDRKKYIMYTGRLSPDKGIYYLISALGTLKEDIPLKVVGNGYDYSDFAKHLNVNYERMSDCSEEKKWEMYEECSFLVCGADNPYIPSLGILEGISCGRSGIVFDYEENQLHYKDFAWYCRPRDIDSLARTISLLWKDGALADDRASKGSEWVENECSYEVWAENINEMFEEAVERRIV